MNITITEKSTAKDILKAIDDWAYEHPNEHPEIFRLWDVLTALRGPDFVGDHGLKHQTTAIIRRFSVPSLAQGALATVNYSDHHIVAYNAVKGMRGHFTDHIKKAITALEYMENNG